MIVDKLEVKIGADTSEFDRASERTKESLKSVVNLSERAMQSVQRNLGDALGDFLITGDFKFDKIAKSLARVVGGQILASGGINGGQSNGYGNPLGGFFEKIFSGILGGARAQGGFVSSGVPYLVGERGAEVFVPSSSGYIQPNGAGKNVNINMTVVTGDASSFRASQGQIMAEIAAGIGRAKRNL